MPLMREERQRVVLAGRQAFPLHHVASRTACQDADDAEDQVDEEREVVGRGRRRSCGASVSHSITDATAAPTRPISPSPSDRHPLARLAERLGQHRGDRGQRRRMTIGMMAA